MAGTISKLEIFGAGSHRGSGGLTIVTEADLDEIVSAFSALESTNIVKPHLKLGHEDAQKWFGQSKGIPTLGWITRVWREGRKLLADIANVPDALIEMIKARRYHNVSAEVYWDSGLEHDGKKFSRVLSAVALLGTEMPAVKDLAGLQAALFADTFENTIKTPVVQLEAELAQYTQEQVDALVNAAVSKATSETTSKFSSQVAGLEAQVQVLTKRSETAEGALRNFQADTQKREAVIMIDQAIKDGKMLPAQKDFALAFINGSTGMIKFGEGEKTAAQLFQDFLNAAGKQVNLNESGNTTPPKQFATAAQELDHRVKILMGSDTKVNYSDAMTKVLDADADLKSRYTYGA